MASHNRRAHKKCRKCGTPGRCGENLSYGGLCDPCSVELTTAAAREMAEKRGPHYDRWRRAMRATFGAD